MYNYLLSIQSSYNTIFLKKKKNLFCSLLFFLFLNESYIKLRWKIGNNYTITQVPT